VCASIHIRDGPRYIVRRAKNCFLAVGLQGKVERAGSIGGYPPRRVRAGNVVGGEDSSRLNRGLQRIANHTPGEMFVYALWYSTGGSWHM
jgi:hypothetical protein